MPNKSNYLQVAKRCYRHWTVVESCSPTIFGFVDDTEETYSGKASVIHFDQSKIVRGDKFLVFAHGTPQMLH